jgi:hypothetical protein
MVSPPAIAGRIAFAAGSVAFTALALVPLIRDSPPERGRPAEPAPAVQPPAVMPDPATEFVVIREEPTDSIVLVASENQAELVRSHDRVEAGMRAALGEAARDVMVMVIESDAEVAGVVKMLEEQNLATISMGGRRFQVVDMRATARLFAP